MSLVSRDVSWVAGRLVHERVEARRGPLLKTRSDVRVDVERRRNRRVAVEVACASKDLPPGTWLVSYRAVWQLNALTFPNTTCALFADGVPIDTDSGGTVSGGW